MALGGIPRRGIYDNMKTAVDKVKKGKGRVVNARFSALCSHYLFDAEFCNGASGWEKGIVEKNVQDSRRRIWQDAGKQRFSTFAELNDWLLDRCKALWQEVRAFALEHHKGCRPSIHILIWSSHAARLRFCRRLVLTLSVVSARIRLSTIFLSKDRFCGALSFLTKQPSSPKLTSSIQ